MRFEDLRVESWQLDLEIQIKVELMNEELD